MANKPLIRSYVHLQDKPREQHALSMLRQIGNRVEPIMARRGYKITTLMELYDKKEGNFGIFFYICLPKLQTNVTADSYKGITSTMER